MTFASRLALLALAAFTGAAAAQSYPAKPVRFILPFPPGGGFDAIGRPFAEKLSGLIGQPVVVDNRAGASGNIGAAAVARSAPDGYTLLVGTNSTHAANPSLYKKLPYDYVRDFAPVSGISVGMSALVVNPHVPVKTVAELTGLAKKSPGKLTFGHGSSVSLTAIEYYKLLAGIDIDRKSTRLNSSHTDISRMPSSA